MQTSSQTALNSKPHYPVLDGLRGVAAILVVAFHILETFTGGDHKKQIINHGYLAVDFFFLLSGFVVSYAYDDRWNKMTLKGFFTRRLIRLHPMIIMAMFIGAITFYFQDSSFWPTIHQVPVGKFLLVFFLGMLLIPVPLSLDIRGWQEMYPLNGPAWSLFFEYVANILYALFLRRFAKWILAILVVLSAAALIHLATTNSSGDVIGGWSLEPEQFRVGLTRLLFPFLAGLLLQRMFSPASIKHGFLWCSILLLIVLAAPRINPAGPVWVNGLYDSLIIILIFPLIIFLGASSVQNSRLSKKVCKFCGDISYPLYIIHYPFIYLFMAWTAKNNITIDKGVSIQLILVASVVFLGTILLAYAILKLYDEPLRKWLTKKSLL